MIERIKESFSRQQFMQTLGARLVSVEKGVVVIECDYDLKLTQQHQYIHAGAITSLIDTACGYAALTMMDADKEVLSIELKSSMLRPAKVEKVIATGRVIKSGKRITFCEGVLTDETGEIEFTRMSATMITINK